MSRIASEPKQSKAAKWPWFLCALLGLGAGITSALAISGGTMGQGKMMVGRWLSDPSIGAKAANPWLRARIARVGLLGLTKEETLYFDRTTDEAGNPLREACTYKLSGVAIPTRWWSMTIYGGDQFLPRNSDQAGSIDATRALSEGQASWSGKLSATRPADQPLWLSSKAAGSFSITLRLYNPSTVEPAELAKMVFPRIDLIGCDGPQLGAVK
jgi:hypothetical protein